MKRFLLSLFIALHSLGFAIPIEVFVQDNLNLPRAKIQMHSQDDLVEGGRCAHLFFVKDLASGELFVIKRYPKLNGTPLDFKKEVAAYRYLEQKDFHELKVPLVIQTFEDDEDSYLVMSKAKGQSLNHLLKHSKKKATIRVIKEAIQKIAVCLHELHESMPSNSLSKKSGNRIHDDALISYVETILHDEQHELKARYDALKSKINIGDVKIGVTHGDIHPGNIFYDPINHQVTLIDFSTLSANQKKHEGSPIAEEIANFLIHFEAVATLHGLSNHEIRELTEVFKASYPDYETIENEVDFYVLIELMRLLEITSDQSDDGEMGRDLKIIEVYAKRSISSQVIS